jgi:hypothetical protein
MMIPCSLSTENHYPIQPSTLLLSFDPSLDETCRCYNFTDDEFASWQRLTGMGSLGFA